MKSVEAIYNRTVAILILSRENVITRMYFEMTFTMDIKIIARFQNQKKKSFKIYCVIPLILLFWHLIFLSSAKQVYVLFE